MDERVEELSMSYNPLMILYLTMLLLQTIHIFEEMGFKAYEVVGSLKKYLVVASFLVIINYLPLFLILQGFTIGYYMGFLSSLLAVGNGIIHVIGYLRTKSFRGTVGAGIFSGIPLGIIGLLVLIRLFEFI